MNLSEFDYDLAPDQIAQYPLERRDQARLMLVHRSSGEISHHVFSDLPDLLRPSDLLVLNNTKVFPARLFGRRKGVTAEAPANQKLLAARIEVLLIRPLDDAVWEVLVKPGRKMRVGEIVSFGEGQLEGKVLERGPFGFRKIQFKCRGDFETIIDRLGHVPLPPYIKRADVEIDRDRYQTVFAKEQGAVAAPTAGLHFTQAVFDRLGQKGIEFCAITLHVGPGTFQPVHTEHVEEHQMEKERLGISPEAATAISRAKSQGRRIIAVGTTSVRALESASLQQEGRIVPTSGETDLFIYPGFRFACVDGLLTNFHLPRSTLLILVSAFAGRDLTLKAYRTAIEANYRFYSYGDCMLIL